MDRDPRSGVQRRVQGWHDVRMDGMSDLLLRARGMSVLDIGCNRGMVGFEFANNGARLVHGCDNYDEGIRTAREVFADIRNVQSQFEVVDLTRGPGSLEPFGSGSYDTVLLLAVVHKLSRVMSKEMLDELLLHLAARCNTFVAGTGLEEHVQQMDRCFRQKRFEMVQWSRLNVAGPDQRACIWLKS